MAKVRKDNKGRNLRPGETQRADGSYMYVYKLGTKKKYLYDSDLASLRVKEKQINKDKDDGIRTQEAMKLTLNDMFKVYMNNNIKLKPSTRANYLYLWDFYVKEEPFANMPLPQIHRSDILAFYTKLLKHGFAINSLESINTIVHPTLEMAVDDDYIRKNPSKGMRENRMEYEANIFASQASLPDDTILEYIENGYDIQQIARAMSSDINLIALKVDTLIAQGYQLRKQDHRNDFLKYNHKI